GDDHDRPLRCTVSREGGRDDRGCGRHAGPALLRPGLGRRDLRRKHCGRDKRERSDMSARRIAVTLVVTVAAAAGLVAAGLAGASTKAASHKSAVSGSVSFDGIWTSST